MLSIPCDLNDIVAEVQGSGREIHPYSLNLPQLRSLTGKNKCFHEENPETQIVPDFCYTNEDAFELRALCGGKGAACRCLAGKCRL